jgi:hypothetical protein
MEKSQSYFVGLELGQAQNSSALVVLTRPLVLPRDPLRICCYSMRHLQRFPLGTHYSQVLMTVLKLLQAPALEGAVLIMGRTGVGQPVLDSFAESLRHRVTCLFCPVTITSGQEVTTGAVGGLRVPRNELVGILHVLLQNRRLQVARGLPDAWILVRELENFRLKATVARPESFGTWQESHHDELVLALALAAWAGEKALPAFTEPGPTRFVT